MTRNKKYKSPNLFTLAGIFTSALYLVAFFLFVDRSSMAFSRSFLSLSTIIYASLMIAINLGYLFLPRFAYRQAQAANQNSNILDAPHLETYANHKQSVQTLEPAFRYFYSANILVLIVFIILTSINFDNAETAVYSMIYAIVWTLYGTLSLSSR